MHITWLHAYIPYVHSHQENNGAVTKGVTELLAEFDIPANRIYITFNDIARENMGYNGATFAG